MNDLTPRQQDVLAFIRAKLSEGWPVPSIREIAAHLGLSSPSAAHLHVKALERKGLLKSETNAARSLRLPEQGQLEKERAKDTGEKRVPGIPLLGAIPAGFGDLRTQEPEGMIHVDIESLRIPKTHRTFALRVTGDSMTGKHIMDGDIVILEQNADAKPGDVVAALIDGQSTLKTLVKERGKVWLRAENPKYPNLLPLGDLMIQGVLRMVVRDARPRAK